MSLKTVSAALKKYKSFLVTTHTSPDADALSSCLAMSLFLRGLGKRVQVVHAEDIPLWLKFLPHSGSIKKIKKGEKLDFEAAVVLDCGDLKRIGAVEECLNRSPHVLINIDHHITNTLFGDENWVAPRASSTAEMLYDLFCSLSSRVTRPMALLLYTGIMTDTGSFRFDNTSAHTHAVSGELMRFGIPVAALYHRLYEGVPIALAKDFLRILGKVQMSMGNRLAQAAFPEAAIQRFSRHFDLREKIFSFFRSFEGVEVVVIFTQLDSGKTRVNFRSQTTLNVAQLAKKFGGGGHVRASGCTLEESLPRARAKILTAIKGSL